ncbi:MAG: BatD family protein [Elusimicrobia bacterium]|nr:BatD family protein [Elusimicrobiota bacterium]
MLKRFFTFAFFILFAALGFCQVDIDVYADKTNIDLSEEIQLTITVKSSSTEVEVSQMPSLPNFNIYSSGQSRNISMINGKINATQQFNYILIPRFAGKSSIDAFTVTVSGKDYYTEPIEVEVSRTQTGNAEASLVKQNNSAKSSSEVKLKPTAPKSDKDTPAFFMTASADKTTAYINEQINLKVRFYQSQSTNGSPMYDRPKMEGLVFEELGSKQEFEVINGRQYVYTQFDLAVFGILPGKATIGPANVEYRTAGDIFDPFYSFFSASKSDVKKVSSKPISVNILPLPKAGRTKTFYNAVGGGYSIKASVDNQTPQAGEPVTLSVTVKGQGNMRAVGEVPAPELGKSFRVYETTSSFTSKASNGVLGGSKVYKTVIVPRASGLFTIPPVEFTYFDVKDKTYKTVKSNPIDLEVSPSDSSSAAPISFSSAANGSSSGGVVEQIVQDIRYIKDGKTSKFSGFLTAFGALGAWHYLIFVLLGLGGLGYVLLKSPIPVFSKKKAFLGAKKALLKAKSVAEVSQILTKYIETKLGRPMGIMSISDCAGQLKLSSQTAYSLETLWQEFEMLKYAPSSALNSTVAAEEAAQKTLAVVQDIEKEVK